MNCRDCEFWVWDPGIWCFNGWSGINREDGHCHIEPKKIYKHGSDFCGEIKPKGDVTIKCKKGNQ